MLDWWLPEDVSTYGPVIDQMFHLIYWITSVTFVGVTVCMLVFLFKYRHREGRRATYTHGNTTLEIIWTIIPAMILVLLGIMSRGVWAEIKQTLPPTDVVIRVTARQFAWKFLYAGPDGKFDTADDVEIPDELHIPLNKIVRVQLMSEDVIHSFFLPNLRFKQDVVPGRMIQGWFQATKAGEYDIPCAELCGFGHSGMKGRLFVHDAGAYDAWVKERWPS
jgi:cytochrome c oxidase subunit II